GKGYTAVCVSGVTTGFGKASGGKLKNKYPKGLRNLK
ncbi:MAG: methyltransferase RsmF C-terminal domain-like protein, partial [Neglectibacter timonensis]